MVAVSGDHNRTTTRGTVITGWYNSTYNSDLSVWNWNKILDKYDPRDSNDVSKYTPDSYVAACKRLVADVKPGGKVYIPLPWDQVYNGDSGIPDNILWWWEHIVFELDKFEQVAGYYMADEPEHWNTQWGDRVYAYQGPEHLYKRYAYMKTLSKKPVLVVHCDLNLYDFNRKYCDVFGVDIYPFKQDGDIPMGTFRNNVITWKQIASHFCPLSTIFVFQGCGDSAGYGQRNFLASEGISYLSLVVENFDAILFWDFPHADESMKTVVWNMQDYVRTTDGKPNNSKSLLSWLMKVIRTTLSKLRR